VRCRASRTHGAPALIRRVCTHGARPCESRKTDTEDGGALSTTIDVVLIGEDASSLASVEAELARSGLPCAIRRALTEPEMLAACRCAPDVLVALDSDSTFDAIAMLAVAREVAPSIPLIVIANAVGEEVAVEALKAGATDYIIADRLSRLSPAVRRALDEARARREKAAADAELERYSRDLERMVRDRTDQLLAANEALQKATETRIRFLSSMSHELRVPLNSVIGFAGVLLQGLSGPLTADQRRQLEIIYEAGRRLMDTIDDVLDVSRIEAGKEQVHWEQFELDTVLSVVADSMRTPAAGRGNELIFHRPEEPLTIVSDRHIVADIVTCLLDNAVKFTDGGRIDIGVARSGAGMVTVSVRDTGVGIPADEIATVFDEFKQVWAGEGTRPPGAGLGLSICTKLTALIGGTLSVTSEVGRGSEFVVSIPVGPVVDLGGEGP
jgi:signal transduction histidine kinase